MPLLPMHAVHALQRGVSELRIPEEITMAERPPPRYSEIDTANIRYVRRTTEKAYRVHTATTCVMILLMFGLMALNVTQRNTLQHQRPRPDVRTSDCIRAPSNNVTHTIWPSSDAIRTCIANHAVFVQLEHYCRAIKEYNEVEVHSYLDRARKKLTLTVNVRRHPS